MGRIGLEQWRKVPPSQEFSYFVGSYKMSYWQRDFGQAYEWASKIQSGSPFMQTAWAVMMVHARASQAGVGSVRGESETLVEQLEMLPSGGEPAMLTSRKGTYPGLFPE